ncbi:MAG: ATP-binding cassette protein [Mucilaginibacter sp.]|nr:ATP-binding cassette protein [Mucilaginibacter sp.]
MVMSILDIAFLGLMLLVINFYTKNNASNTNSFLDHFFNKNSLLLISGFFLLFGLKNLLGYFISRAQNFFFYQVASRLSDRNIKQYLKAGYLEFINVDSSVQIRKISQQPIEFSTYILTNVQQIISQAGLIFFTIVAILFYHPSLFLLLFILLLPPVILLAWFVRKKLKNIRADTKSISAKVIQHLQESLSGFIESNIYRKDDFFVNRYHTYQDKLNKNIATQQTLQGLPSRLIEVFAILGFFILIVINKWSINAPGINLLNIGVFMAASYKIIPGIVKILNSSGQIKAYSFTLTDLLPPDTITTVKAETREQITSMKFKKINFKFKKQQILRNLCLEITSGDFAGISGKSGLGKTTIINLLLGFLEPQSGDILVNNKTVNAIERQQYWPVISYVKQQAFFINDSILKNITLTDDDYDAAKLAKAISICGIDCMLNEYADGINKQITENGKNISGGQRQRIVLARALYYDFDLLILDEPFSEIDTEAENTILTRLKQLTEQGKMVLFITHNTASLTFCNKIIIPNAN